MQVCFDVPSLQESIAKVAQPLCLVPTMGALHEGHRALMRRARQLVGDAGTVAASIFVNPLQFDRGEDFEKYPRPMERDLAACREEGVDLVFAPAAAAMYAPDHSVVISENALSQTLCGASRPGHFAGVCTVVMKLFQAFQCRSAVFGEKDFQQLAIIRRMVRDLHLPVQIVAHETLREADGLAMSSRNVRLAVKHRADAPCIRQALLRALAVHRAGETQADAIIAAARELLEASPFLQIDYLSLVDADGLYAVEHVAKPAVLAFAGYYGAVRLIDHVTLGGVGAE
jgi:pantoate--beta-alanine ligase